MLKTNPTTVNKIIARPEQGDVFLLALEGYGWIYGVHGIGKTTLAREVFRREELRRFRVHYVDCRLEAHSYDSLAHVLLNALKRKVSGDAQKDFRSLRNALERPLRKQVRFVIDEIEAFPVAATRPVIDLFHATSHNSMWSRLGSRQQSAEHQYADVGAIFISAQAPGFFRVREDQTSERPGMDLELRPLSHEGTTEYFRRLGVAKDRVPYLTHLSGGNPTLMHILGQMYLDTLDTDVFGEQSHRWLVAVYSYFESVWKCMTRPEREHITLASILIFHYRNDTAEWRKMKGRLSKKSTAALSGRHGAMSFGLSFPDLSFASRTRDVVPDIVSPLFMAWLLRQHAENFEQAMLPHAEGKTDRRGAWGWSLSDWRLAATVLTTVKSAVSMLDALLR